MSGIADPALRAIAERGRYLVVTAGCIADAGDAIPGPQGPQFDKYLGGGVRFMLHGGTFVSRNLTPDTETGLGRRTDDEVTRVLRSGVFPDGHVTSHRTMPWGAYTNFTDEDLYAVVFYLRHIPAVRHRIPEPAGPSAFHDATALEDVQGREAITAAASEASDL